MPEFDMPEWTRDATYYAVLAVRKTTLTLRTWPCDGGADSSILADGRAVETLVLCASQNLTRPDTNVTTASTEAAIRLRKMVGVNDAAR
jgi:hypothetical protein